MQVRVRLPGIGMRDAEVAWAEYPNFTCVFRSAASTDEAASTRTRRKSAHALVRAVAGLGGLLLLAALLWTLWS